MQTTPASRLSYSPDLEAESSFPERHLDDDKPQFSGNVIGTGRYQSGVKRQVFEPSLPTVYARDWPGQGQAAFPHDSNHVHIPSHGPLVDSNPIAGPFPQPQSQPPTPGPLSAGSWTAFREQPQDGFMWQASRREFSVDDDSDSIQSRNESHEDFCPSLPTLSAQKVRRRSSHRVTKPAKPIPTHHLAARPERPYIPDFDYNTDWLDPSDASVASFSHSHSSHDLTTTTTTTVPTGNEIEIALRDSAASASKVDSKRIAHKLSEKSRRNRLTIAIREIQKLLPSGVEGEDLLHTSKEADYVVRPGVPSSKLDIVEMAVGFIRDLKARQKSMAERVRVLEKQLEECQCRHPKGEHAEVSMSNAPALEGTGA
ncbi:hypothetical protein C7999DRAFT_18259 [Corynascus novoguineensis]|uniref:BHLH domain-containing protein n=1 Tax=Corynascus novoguineensis TaxID=1126955 RepID=A0AAN7HB66_9PEZI|nr:hypothetical protein C7999DRAFT_18259 [Corynascus novoguineensis]